jgi:hypothetical protein
MKVDGLTGRNWLKRTAVDAIHAILCAADQNLRLLLRAIAAFLRLDTQRVVEWLKSLRLSWADRRPITRLTSTGYARDDRVQRQTQFFRSDYRSGSRWAYAEVRRH